MEVLDEEEKMKCQYLKYDFMYEGRRHKGKIRLVEDVSNVVMMYDDHDLEVTWVKRIRHKGKCIEINIVVHDDWNDYATLGQVAASAWVCVYDITDKRRHEIIDQFEPDYWAYIDEECPENNTDKSTFCEK